MRTRQSHLRKNDGFTLVYMAVTLTVLLLGTGIAVDSGRAYVVKAQLTKAVDGAALAAARSLNSGSPRAAAERVFKANFPNQYLGTVPGDPTTAANFYTSAVDPNSGTNTVTVTATAVLPTTFMQLGNIMTVTVGATGEATRRMVDLSLVIDVSSSIGVRWPAVRDASRMFIDSFDALHDRLSLVLFSNGAQVIDAMPAARGFDKAKLINDVPQNLPGGSTLMVEGLYHGWDELRTVPAGQQSGLRIIVLFTDGASSQLQ
jgi:Flp pilus assembly protein TadG